MFPSFASILIVHAWCTLTVSRYLQTQEFTLKNRLILLLLFVVIPAFAQTPIPEIPYESIADFPKLPPDLYLGEVAGVAPHKLLHVLALEHLD